MTALKNNKNKKKLILYVFHYLYDINFDLP